MTFWAGKTKSLCHETSIKPTAFARTRPVSARFYVTVRFRRQARRRDSWKFARVPPMVAQSFASRHGEPSAYKHSPYRNIALTACRRVRPFGLVLGVCVFLLKSCGPVIVRKPNERARSTRRCRKRVSPKWKNRMLGRW